MNLVNHLAISAVIGFSVIISACTPAPEEHHESILVFGTIVDITFYDVDRTKATQAFAVLNEDFQRMHTMWHPWNPGALQRTNQLLSKEINYGVWKIIHLCF